MPKLYRVELTSEERSMLTDMVKRRSPTALPVRRAFMLLKADEAKGRPAWSDAKIAESYAVSIRTVESLRERFVEEGLDVALAGKKRAPKKERIFDGEVEAHLVALRCSAPPAGQAQWSLRLLRDKMVELGYVETISHESVRQLLKKNELKPWQVKSWGIPPGGDDQARAAFVCQMEQVLDVYACPYDPARPVVCLDETRKQLVSEKRLPFTDSKGVVHLDYEYKREGVATIYMLCEPLGSTCSVSPWAATAQSGLQRVKIA